MPTPEEIKAAKDAERKKAAEEAARKKAKSQGEEDDEEPTDDDESEGEEGDKGADKGKGKSEDDDQDDKSLGFTEKQQAYIKKLRSEAAKHRNEVKTLGSRFEKLETGLKTLFGGEDDSNLTPEERLEKVKADNAKLAQEKDQILFNQSLAEAAIEHGVKKENLKFFKFLVAEKAEALKEGEELSEDDIKKLAKEANKSSAPRSSSVETDDNGTPAPDGEDGDISVEEFMAMGISARSALYGKDKALYEKLMAKEREAKKKKR